MGLIYKLGIVCGIIVLYVFFTYGLASLLTFADFDDDTKTAIIAWMLGALAFLVLAIFTMSKFNLWGM